MALSGFGQAYLENLRDLTTTERRAIVTMKDLALENPEEAASVVAAIRQHVRKCAPAHHVATLYLVDCMLKAEPCPPVYMKHLTHALLEIFVFMWDSADAGTRTTLAKVCKLWRSVPSLDQKVVQACETYMVPAGLASTSGVPAVGGVLPPPNWGYPVTQPATAHSTVPGYRPLVGSRPGYDPRAQPPGQQHYPAQQQTAAAAAYHHYRPVTQPMGSQVSAYAPLQPQHQQHVQHQHQPRAPYLVPAAYSQLPYPHPPASSSQPTIPMARAAVPVLQPAQPSVAPRSPLQPAPHSPSQLGARVRPTEFPGPQVLKELDAAAVQDLAAASARTRPAFLDAAFLRNKRRMAQAAAGTASRQWYPTVDIWLVGTTSLPDEAAQTAAEEASDKPEQEQLYSVEEDPSQPECAISGEPFERFYDPDSDKWCYKDAVLLSGEDAAKYGVMDGSIVKVQCLAGAPSKLQLASLRAATATDAVAADLRQAAQSRAAGGSGSSGAAAEPLQHAAAAAVPAAAATPPAALAAASPLLQPQAAAAAPVAALQHQAQQQPVWQPAGPSAPAPVAAAAAGQSAAAAHVLVKQEPSAHAAPIGAVGFGPGAGAAGATAGQQDAMAWAAAAAAAGSKRGAAEAAAGGGQGAAGALAAEAKRVKLEVQ